MSNVLDSFEVSDFLSLESRFDIPASPLFSALCESEFHRSDPAYLRSLSQKMHDLPDRRRAWLLEFADRIEAAGYASFAEVPVERFEEIARLY